MGQESPEDQENPGNPENAENQSASKGDGAATPKAESPEISYDKLIKTGLRAHYGDVVEWLVKERPLEVRTLEPVQDTTVERLGDKLWEARFEDKPGLILHVEWQLESDKKLMPVRMLQFASLVLELLSL